MFIVCLLLNRMWLVVVCIMIFRLLWFLVMFR